MKVCVYFVEKQYHLTGGTNAEMSRGTQMFTPGPHQHVGKTGDPADRRGCVHNWYSVGIVGPDRRDILRVIDGKPQERTDFQ